MKIHLAYDSEKWDREFREESIRLDNALVDIKKTIEHIGSTAVPGLAAKPIIDIMIGIDNISRLDEVIKPIMDIGYYYFPFWESDWPDRRFFCKWDPEHDPHLTSKTVTNKEDFPNLESFPRKFHVHVVPKDGPNWERHILFRNYLRNNETARDRYFNLKEDLARKEWKCASDYSEAKTSLIRKMESEAKAYFK